MPQHRPRFVERSAGNSSGKPTASPTEAESGGNPIKSPRDELRSQDGGSAVKIENSNMTAKKRSRRTRSAGSTGDAGAPTPATMVPASESAWTGARTLAESRSAGLSRQRMIDARGELLRSEREYMAKTSSAEVAMSREAEALERQAAEIQAETWALERESETRARVLLAQARLETELANRIKEIAERSALSVLDRIKEASDSMLGWAGKMGDDMKDMLWKEAAEQVARKVADIDAVQEAMDEESRAIELLELTARYKRDQAA